MMQIKKRQHRHEEIKALFKTMRSFQLAFRHLLEDDLRADGLSLAQMRLLYAVQEKNGVSAAELARTCEVAPQSMQALLTRAEREKWIRRSKSAKNNRIVTTELTAKGKAVLERAHSHSARVAEMMWGKLPLSKIHEFQELLQEGIRRAEEKRAKTDSEKMGAQ